MKKEVMKKAHQIAKTLEGDYKARMAFSLRQAWKEMKMEMEIKNMTLEELEELKARIEQEIAQKKNEQAEEFTFDFEHTSDPRKGTPYVAKLTIGEDGKIQRSFFDMNRTYGKKEVTVSGQYTAKAGDIVEERHGGSWKNDYRYWYLITPEGEQKEVAHITESSKKTQVQKYLRGEITMEELIAQG